MTNRKENLADLARMKAKRVYLLTGKVVCGNCDSPYTGASYTDKGHDRSYYKCNKGCGNTGIQKDELEDYVIDYLLTHTFSDAGTDNMVERVNNLYIKRRRQAEDDIEPLKRELDTIHKTLDNYMAAIAKGTNPEVVNHYIDEANSKRIFLEHELAKAIVAQNVEKLDENKIKAAMEKSKTALKNDDDYEKREVIQIFIDKVIIDKPGDDDKNKTRKDISLRAVVRVVEISGIEPLTS